MTLAGISVAELWQGSVEVGSCPACGRRHRIRVKNLEKWCVTEEQVQAMEDLVTASASPSLGIVEEMNMPDDGAVRLSATEGMATQWLLRRLRPLQLRKTLPQVQILQTDRVVDLGAGEADIAIRFGFSPSPGLVGSKIGCFGMSVMAAASYLERFGTPRTIEDLKHHRIVDHSTLHQVEAMAPWSRAIAYCSIAWSSTSTWQVLELVKEGEGLSVFPDYISDKHHLFKTPVELNIAREVWVVAREAALTRPSVAAVVDLLRRHGGEAEEEWFRPAADVPPGPVASA